MILTPEVLRKLIELGRSLAPVTVAVCHPRSEVALRGAVEAGQAQLIAPVLVSRGPWRPFLYDAAAGHL